ncbi:gluconate 2-dehydrogenase subunit 3 family protein [Microbacterium sp. STN6]|uniref:gluconate 2-dehydrogenase subunit 3 family protein n=1 Tax=Microbacterium sp. STN6 TaxID=2995588 RepID=UPI002260D491|nr:gluconate 2-dehydrogenase subunit 3 family protein [Microbacterium sp. STN6]MCX7523116.1 gluconate 2-dehydrogenase subunit 3 family protein [Microbacterium sp. STN6]
MNAEKDFGSQHRHGYGADHPRFPGFDVLGQAGAWDDVTRELIVNRLNPDPHLRFFTATEFLTAAALLDQLTGQIDDPIVPVAQMIDIRMADDSTDGWHFEGMPRDHDVWKATVHGLDDDAHAAHGKAFADCDSDQQQAILTAIHKADPEGEWHGMNANRTWNLWMRYACTAFYSHPAAWNEIGFSGPAYPRGYKNAHVGTLEPYEVHDAMPKDDPAREGRR